MPPNDRVALACALSCLLAACGGEDSSSSSTSTAGSGGTTATTTTAGGGAGGSGGTTTGGTAGAAGGGGAIEFIPTPADIDYGADAPIPTGQSILFNDWNAFPNTVSAMSPDGTGAIPVFHAYRVWSMGATAAGDRIAFACGDPKQEEHYGLNLGDAIQHSWLYDTATEQISLLSHGNINDECHLFGPGGQSLYLCRRYDFQPDFSNKGYRLGRIDLSTLAFEFLTPDQATILDIDPAPTPDEASLLFTRITISGGKQSRSVMKEPLPMAAPTELRADAGSPRLSPDGQRYLYVDYTDTGNLWSSKLDGTDPVKVVNRPAGGARYSPDGARIVYQLYDGAANCNHVEIVAADGSEADSPTRVRDCSVTGEFITEVAWIDRPM